jgi:hypothetical protein
MTTTSKLKELLSLNPLYATIKKAGRKTNRESKLIQLKIGCRIMWLGLVENGIGGSGALKK